MLISIFHSTLGSVIKGDEADSPVALESCIGWVLTGPYKSELNIYTSNLSTVHVMQRITV